MDATTLVGQTLGCYRVGRVIGRGGMGVVYRARDLEASRDVALKVLGSGAGPGAGNTERFRREALWLTHCDDPHIVRVYATGQVGGIDYIAMELMATTLQERIAPRHHGVAGVVEVGAGILLGLAAAHRAGIIHRDIKPANVGIAGDGAVKLLDFGIANPLPWSVHIEDAETSEHDLACVGSLHYMPPEQLRGDPIDERADVYSTGAVLYELSTGLRPFPEVRLACLIDAILNNPPVPPSSLNAQVAPGLDYVVLRALAKNPSARFQSAFEMMDALLNLSAIRRDRRQTSDPTATHVSAATGSCRPR